MEVATLPPSAELARQMESHFAEFRAQSAVWMGKAKEIKVTDIGQKDLMAEARKARLELRKIRLAVADKHQELKAEALLTGQTLDKIKRELTGMIEPIEAILEAEEKFAETQEKNRLNALRADRLKALDGLIPEEDAQRLPLAEMSPEAFTNMLTGYKLAKENRDKKEKEEADEREKFKQQKAARTKIRMERLLGIGFMNGMYSLSHNGFSVLIEDVENVDDGTFEKLFSDGVARNEEQKKKDAANAKRKASRAPDKVKLLAYAVALQAVKPGNMTTEEGEAVLSQAKGLVVKLVDYVNKQADKL